MRSIDLNADLGEGAGSDAELLRIVSSCNVACGGHAGDIDSMRATVDLAIENSVSVGAHPSYPDREGFGRRSNFLHSNLLLDPLLEQISALEAIASDRGIELTHVKPHGALYNDAVRDQELANTIVEAVVAILPAAAFVGLPNSELETAATGRGLRFIGEGFVDRAYQADGQLVPRSEEGAVHESLALILPQAVSLVGRVDTLCIHGDTPGAAGAARAVRDALEDEGIEIRAFGG